MEQWADRSSEQLAVRSKSSNYRNIQKHQKQKWDPSK